MRESPSYSDYLLREADRLTVQDEDEDTEPKNYEE
jgi:hypothetical protein